MGSGGWRMLYERPPRIIDRTDQANRMRQYELEDAPEECAAMFLDDVCSAQGCDRTAAMFCFECDRWFCREHLTQMAVVVRPVRTETLACPACLEDHLFAPRSLRELLYESVGRDLWDSSFDSGDDLAQ